MQFIFIISFVSFVMFLLWGIAAKFQRKKSRWKLLISLLSLVVVFIATPSPSGNSSEQVAVDNNSVPKQIDDKVTNANIEQEPSESKTISSDSNVQDNHTISSSNESDEGIDPKIIYSLGTTPKQFQKKFNLLAKKQGLENLYQLKPISIDSNATVFDSFQEPLTNKLTVTGFVNKSDGTIAYIQVVLKPDGTQQDETDLKTIIPLLMSVIDSTITDEKKGLISSQSISNLLSKGKGIELHENEYDYMTLETPFGLIFRISKSVD
ncbi:hypothetical protein [Paenibacillus sp. DRB1-1]|uniref:hypothetical protein n=1 Tax=Paenibacillus sp. DRB1-1 TaxID=3422309 RepID=UPI003F972489